MGILLQIRVVNAFRHGVDNVQLQQAASNQNIQVRLAFLKYLQWCNKMDCMVDYFFDSVLFDLFLRRNMLSTIVTVQNLLIFLFFYAFQRVLQRQASLGKRTSIISNSMPAPTLANVSEDPSPATKLTTTVVNGNNSNSKLSSSHTETAV